MCLVTPARLAKRRTIRVAAWRFSRFPARVSSSGPWRSFTGREVDSPRRPGAGEA